MKKQYIILSVSSIIIALAGLYAFTDIFLSPEQKFIKELEYYENVRYTSAECTIYNYQYFMNELFFGTIDIIEQKVTKEELRTIVARDSSFGFNWKMRDSYMSFSDSSDSGISYDNQNLVLWVYEYNTDYNEDWMIYWWSPK